MTRRVFLFVEIPDGPICDPLGDACRFLKVRESSIGRDGTPYKPRFSCLMFRETSDLEEIAGKLQRWSDCRASEVVE